MQVFTGGNKRTDRAAAYDMQKRCQKAFPELGVYVEFVSPHWVCRIGDFRRNEDARRYANKANAFVGKDGKQLTFEARVVRSKVFFAQ